MAMEHLPGKATEQGFVLYDDILGILSGTGEDPEGLDGSTEAGVEPGILEGQVPAADGATGPETYADLAAAVDLDNLYFKEIGHAPLLTAEEEVVLAERMKAGLVAQGELDRDDRNPEQQAALRRVVQDGQAAREHLVHANFRLVISVAKRYAGCGLPLLDLVQEGNIGLIHAVDRFDHRFGNKFATYATWWVRQAIGRAVANQGRTVRLPAHVNQQIHRLRQTARRLMQELDRDPTVDELADAMDIPLHKVEQTSRLASLPLSLAMPVGDEGESTLADFIEDEKALATDDAVESSVLRALLWELLQGLPSREARILRLRYGLADGDPFTLSEISKKLGITGERVRQLEAKALRRLRHPAHSRRLKGFLK
jgi:RNA polymerase primary sigma factor